MSSGGRQMRVLFTVQPASGHLQPLVPVANALADSGHEVAVCSAASFRPEFAAFVVRMFADITTRQMVPDLLAIAREWRPDVIVREGMEYGGCIAAECLGIPHASIAGNAYAAVDSPEVHYFPGNRMLVAEPLARHREEFGLPPDPDLRAPFRHLHLCFTPPSWDGNV